MKAGGKQSGAGISIPLLFDIEEGGDMFFRNVC
jgi:hypothetical protein